MAGILNTLVSLAAAGTMMVSTTLDTAAPQHDGSGTLFLVNRSWRISEAYQPEVVSAEVPGQYRKLREDAAAALAEMFAACKAETGVTLIAISGYRSFSKQASLYSRKLRAVGSEALADEYVARPGASEHQLGLAMDVNQRGSRTGLTDSFADTAGGQWLADNCWRFGFILRYRDEWESVTGYRYEPWHVRYVGPEAARAVFRSGLPFETWLSGVRADRLLELLQ